MSTLASRDKDGKPALWHVDAAIWEEARDLVKEEVEKAVLRELKINVGGTTKDNKITFEHTNCLGMCDQGPAMMVNDKIYTKLTPEKAVDILKKVN